MSDLFLGRSDHCVLKMIAENQYGGGGFFMGDIKQGINQLLKVEDISLQDIVDVGFLQEFQDNFAESLGVASITVDIHGNPVTKPSNFTDFCMKYTRGSEVGQKRCMECDRTGGEESARSGKPAIYECHAGLVDFAAPIMLEGRQLGSILGGQVLTTEPDEIYYRKVAEEIGINPDEYIQALGKIKQLPRKSIEAAANVLYFTSIA